MKKRGRIIVTRKEVARLLGIKMLTLAGLENAAGMSPSPRRTGYTLGELNAVKAALGKVLSDRKSFS